MTFHPLDELSERLEHHGRTNQKSFLSNPMITACPERTAETAWFFATRGDASLTPRKILPTSRDMVLTYVRPYKPQLPYYGLGKAYITPSYSSVRPYIVHVKYSTRVYELSSRVCESVGCASIFRITIAFFYDLTYVIRQSIRRHKQHMTYDTPYICTTNYIQNPYLYRNSLSTCTCHLRHVHSDSPQSRAISLYDTDPTYSHTSRNIFCLISTMIEHAKSVRSNSMYVYQ